MAVPDTNTFSLQDVVDEINPTTDDLQDCVDDANSSDYDTTYYTAPATSLLEFRNYGAGYTQIKLVGIENSGSAACLLVLLDEDEVAEAWFHNGAGPYPTIGDIIYATSSGGARVGGNAWYYVRVADYSIQIDNNGYVIDDFICNQYTAFQMTTQKYYTESNINCSDNTYTTYYHNGSGDKPVVGDTIYEDGSGVTPHNGLFFGNDAWRVLAGYAISVAVSSTGVVTGESYVCAK